MSETMSHVERVLWRIAELGARCSQQAATGERAALWAEPEQPIAGLDEEFEAAGRDRARALEKARKAIAVTTEAKAATLEAGSTAAECVARASAAENSVKK